MKIRALALSAAILLTLTSASAFAALIGPTFPPIGGASFATSGAASSAGHASGRTFFYTGMNPAAYDDLFYTFSSVLNPFSSDTGSTGGMVFSGYNASTGIATWVSTVNLTYATASGTFSTGTRLDVQFQAYTGFQTGPLGSGWLVPTTAGAAGISGLAATQSVLDVDNLPNPDNFQVWFRYATSGGIAILDLFDSQQTFGQAIFTNTTGGFYYDLPVVAGAPEPLTVALLGLGLAGIGFARRRKA